MLQKYKVFLLLLYWRINLEKKFLGKLKINILQMSVALNFVLIKQNVEQMIVESLVERDALKVTLVKITNVLK